MVKTHLSRFHYDVEGCIEAFRELGGLDGRITVPASDGSRTGAADARIREVVLVFTRPVRQDAQAVRTRHHPQTAILNRGIRQPEPDRRRLAICQMLQRAILVPLHPGRPLGVFIENPGVFEEDNRTEQIFQAVQQSRMRRQIPRPTKEQVQSISTSDTPPKSRPRLLEEVTIVPDLLGREDRDRVNEAQFLIASYLLGREDSLSRDRHPLVSWLIGMEIQPHAMPRAYCTQLATQCGQRVSTRPRIYPG